MSGGGQSISGESRYDWNPYMANMWAGGTNEAGDVNPGLLGRAVDTLNSPYQQYGGQRLADRTWDQTAGQDATRHLALAGATEANSARNTLNDTAQGKYLGQYDSSGNWVSANPYSGLRATPGENEYGGQNEAFLDMKRRNLQDVSRAFQEGTAADTQRMFAQSGAFGGSAHQQAVERNNDVLAKNMGDIGTRMEAEQYDRSANLRENSITRGLQSQMFDIGRLNQDYQNERSLMQGAIPLGLQSEAGRLGAVGQLYGIGGDQQRHNQMGLDQEYENWANKNNWERNNVNWMANLLAQAQGGIGGQATQTQPGYGINPLAGLLAAGSLYGAMR